MRNHVRLISLLLLVGIVALGSCSSDESDNTDDTAQSREIVIGVLNVTETLTPSLTGFQENMTAYGYNAIQYEYGGVIPPGEALQIEAQRLVDMDVDLILALGTPAAQAAQLATAENDIPVVFAPLADPVQTGLVNSIEAPGNNLTGIWASGNTARTMEILLEIQPEVQRIFIPYLPADNVVEHLEAIDSVADNNNITIIRHELASPDAVTAAVDTIPDNADAVFLVPDAVALAHAHDFETRTIELGIPLVSANAQDEHVLFVYGIDLYNAGQQAARLANLILTGSDPGTLPVEQAEFFLTINLAYAEQIALTISPDMLQAAHRIIRQEQ